MTDKQLEEMAEKMIVGAFNVDFKRYHIDDTLEGTMEFRRGDMLIVGVKGEFYPCKPDIFEKTYEKV